jgi:hypothetical protein
VHSANHARACALYAQNAALDSALDRLAPKAVAVFAVVVEGFEVVDTYDVLPDGTQILVPVRRAVTRSVRLNEVA